MLVEGCNAHWLLLLINLGTIFTGWPLEVSRAWKWKQSDRFTSCWVDSEVPLEIWAGLLWLLLPLSVELNLLLGGTVTFAMVQSRRRIRGRRRGGNYERAVISCGYLRKFIPPIWTRLNGHFSAMNYLKPIMKTHWEGVQGRYTSTSVANQVLILWWATFIYETNHTSCRWIKTSSGSMFGLIVKL